MNILNTYQCRLNDENGTEQTLCIKMTKSGGIYGFVCSMTPAEDHAEDLNVTDDAAEAENIFGVLCRESVLPLDLYSVLDDLLYRG